MVTKGRWMPPGYKVRNHRPTAPFDTELTPRCRRNSAISLSCKRSMRKPLYQSKSFIKLEAKANSRLVLSIEFISVDKTLVHQIHLVNYCMIACYKTKKRKTQKKPQFPPPYNDHMISDKANKFSFNDLLACRAEEDSRRLFIASEKYNSTMTFNSS